MTGRFFILQLTAALRITAGLTEIEKTANLRAMLKEQQTANGLLGIAKRLRQVVGLKVTSNFVGWESVITFSFGLCLIVGVTGCDEPANWSAPLDLVGDADELIMQQPVAVSEHGQDLAGANKASTDHADPTQVVTRFANAAQRGNARELAALLTDKAQAQLQAQNLELATLGAVGNATFRVHEAEFLANGDAAHVPCLWTDGTTVEPEQVVFVLRRVRQEEAVWRIAGLVSVSSQDPSLTVVIDLESPSDVSAFSTR